MTFSIEYYRSLLNSEKTNSRGKLPWSGSGLWQFKLVKQADNGKRPLYRSSQWQRENRALKRLVDSKTRSKSGSGQRANAKLKGWSIEFGGLYVKGIDVSMFGETGRAGRIRCSEHLKDMIDSKCPSGCVC